MTALINVDPSRQEERGYRYKMSPVGCKVEGSGNGIKTVITNASIIGETLSRNVEYLMRYLSAELATTAKFKDDKWILTGKFDQPVVQEKVFTFISRWVLCKRCNNPETTLYVNQDKQIEMACKSCGHHSSVDMTEKLVKTIMATERPRTLELGKRQRRKEKTKDETDLEVWDKSTRQAGEADTLEADVSPVDLLRDTLKQGLDQMSIWQTVVELRRDYNLSERNLVQLVFEATVTDKVLVDNEIARSGWLLQRVVVSDKTVATLLDETMAFCDERQDAEDPAVAKLYTAFPRLLKQYYDNDVLSDAMIFTWYGGKPSRGYSKEKTAMFKDMAKPVIEWLRQEEEEEEEEEEDDE